MKHLQLFSSHDNYVDNDYYVRVDYCEEENHFHYNDIQFVEKLTTIGTSWIELPIIPSAATDALEIKFQRTNAQNQQRFCHTYGANHFHLYINGSSQLAYTYKAASWTATSWNPGTTLHEMRVDWKNALITYDTSNTITMSRSTPIATTTINLSFFRQYESYATFKGDIYYIKWFRNDELVFDLVPARIGTEGVFYDLLSRKIYKSGNVAFTPGTDI